MNAIDLLDIIGSAKDAYLLEALNSREQKPQPKRLRLSRTFLIAAIIAVTLLLVGCTVAIMLNLDALKLGEEQYTNDLGESQTRTILSLQGFVGTPGYQASKEWYEWEQAYDPDMEVYHSDEAFSEDFGEEYYAYNLYSREMKDKVDELCEKYDLELLGKFYMDTDAEYICGALKIPGILRKGAETQTDLSGYYYQNGSFNLEGHITLTGADTPWPYEELVSFRCNRKDQFGYVYASIGPIGTYEEWTYTNADGIDVLMVLEESGPMMLVDRGEYIFVVSLMNFDDRTMDKAGLEAFADVFDFTIQPQRVSEEELEAAEQRIEEANQQWAEEYDKKFAGYQEKGYEARVKFWMERSTTPSQLGFTLMDLNGDGVEELLIGENGYLLAIYTVVDSGTQHLMMPDLVYNNLFFDGDIGTNASSSPSYIYLCEGNSLAYVWKSTDGCCGYRFAQIENGQYVWKEQIRYDPVNYQNYSTSPWERCDDSPSSEPITEEEFNRIRDSYVRVPVDLYPISKFPLTDDSPSGIGMAPNVYQTYKELVEARTSWERDRSDWCYTFIDLDQDGQEELYWIEGAWKGVLTIENGQVKLLENGSELTICKGNYIERIYSYLDGSKTYCYYKVKNGQAVLVDYLRYDTADPENPWSRSADNSGQDVSMVPITSEEFYNTIAKYIPMALDMKPIEDFPLS